MLYSINFLRFVAAFAVVISHSWNVLGISKKISIGDAGVDIFFVISGFVVGMAAERESSSAAFLVKRLLRIYPLYWIAIGAQVLFLYNQWHVKQSPSDIVHSLTLVPFWGRKQFILFQTWTLTYEMLFYVVLFLALVFFQKKASIATLLVITMISVLSPNLLQQYIDPALMLEFVGGMIIYQFYKVNKFLNITIGGVSLIVATAMFWHYATGAPIRTIHWGIPAALLFCGFLCLEEIRAFRHKAFVVLGAASYSIYLFHLTAMFYVNERVSDRFGLHLRDFPSVSVPILVVFSVAAGVIVHLAIEAPLMKFSKTLVPTRKKKAANAESLAIQGQA